MLIRRFHCFYCGHSEYTTQLLDECPQCKAELIGIIFHKNVPTIGLNNRKP